MFSYLREDIGNLDARIDRRFEAVDRRFEGVERRFEAIDRRFEAIERRFDALDSKMSRQFMWLVGLQVTTALAILSVVLRR